MLRVTGALSIGIGLAASLEPVHVGWPLAAAAGLSIAFFLPLPIEQRGPWRGGAILGLFICLGFLSMSLDQADRVDESHDPEPFFTARLLEAPRGKNNWLGADAELVHTHSDSSSSVARGKIKLMFAREAVQDSLGLSPKLARGSLIVSAAELLAPSPPANPHTFDYKAFLAMRGIHRQAWLRAEDFSVLSVPAKPNTVERIRAYISTRIDAHYWDPRDAGVARALLLGDKSGLDEATQLAYSSTGAVHVLAVSGLHTVVIAAVIVWLLGLIIGERYPWLRFALLALGLFGYALLTGLSESVLRACFMFLLVFAGRIVRRDAHGLNNLGAAAAITLLVSPASLFALGFQLSYLAVAGIMVFYKQIELWMATGNRYVDWAGAAVAVSLAATLGTLPVTIFYFHQFPTYFALSTPVVFGTTAALWALLGELALDGILQLFGISFQYTFVLSNVLIYACNEFLTWLADLPGVLVEGLWPSAITITLLLLTTALAGIVVNRKRRDLAFITAALLLCTGLSALFDAWRKLGEDQLVVYALKNGAVIDIFEHGQLAHAQLGAVTEKEFQREVNGHRAALGHLALTGHALHPVGGDTASLQVFEYADLHWAYISSKDPKLADHPPPVEWVVFAQPRLLEAAEIRRLFPESDILLCERPPFWLRSSWDSVGTRLHILPEQGAYIREL